MSDRNEHENDYKNKYFSILGDSISTFEHYSEPDYAAYYDVSHKLEADVLTMYDTWWGIVIEHFGGELLVNNSFAGSTVCYHEKYEIQSYSCSDERTSSLGMDGISPDVIVVYMGTNDWGCGTSIVGDDDRTFAVAYGQMLEKLKRNYPNAEIWCMTLAESCCSKNADFKFPRCYSCRDIEEYCAAIRECAQKHGCFVVDLYLDAEPYDTIDGFHPNASGMRTLANAVIKSAREF